VSFDYDLRVNIHPLVNLSMICVYHSMWNPRQKAMCFPTHVLCLYCHNPTLRECEDETHTPEMGTCESSGTPKISEFDCQNTSHWGVFYIVGKLSKCRCRKWACMSHLDIYSTSYGKKKGRESNWQFDSQPPKVRNQPNPDACRGSATHHWKDLNKSYNFALDLVPIRGLNKEL